ncbi:hypothetical protein [Parasitella parasitica]|uniref:Nucleolar protein 9 n=1 Tax=Parasitella parasitica TaxID=35722 RepID=A0A0B7MV76_9FUNG|nr:hypothetical protein [Parasitella parasitica]
MPRVERKGRANKKRGKKGGKKQEPEQDTPAANTAPAASMDVDSTANNAPAAAQEGPGGVVFNDQHFQAAHFGEVDEELLGYFKNVEQTLDDPHFETGEDQRLFVENVYSEVDGNEFRLSTNYSCSLILEKLLKVSDSFQLRVFMDKLSGKTVELFAHRFASHVCQTLLTLAADVVEREQLEGASASETPVKEGEGELLSMEDLILGVCEDIKPHVGGLISQQFASHDIRILLFVLAGRRIDESGDIKGQLRSKKSTQYKKENNDAITKSSVHSAPTRKVPDSFKAMFRTLTTELAINMSETEVRTLSVHKVANPVLQLLLEMQENDKEGQKAKNILIDRILWGIVADIDSKEENRDRDAWFETMVRDPVGSHLLEVIVKCAPDAIYRKIFKAYLKGKLEKFSMHPIANFVIQNLITSVRKSKQLDQMMEELGKSFEKLLKFGKYGVIRSLVDASVRMESSQKAVVDALAAALHMAEDSHRKEFVNCCMRMWTFEQWNEASEDEKLDLYKFHLQGSLIVQGIMKMEADVNAIVTNSFLSQRPDTVYRWCFSPAGSRAFESIVASSNVNIKMKKKIMRDLSGKYTALAKDKFGSHILDKCWAAADIDSKEKIAAELVKHEHELASHYIGKSILWTCKIDQYKRRHEDWVEREKGAERKREMFRDILDDTPVDKKHLLTRLIQQLPETPSATFVIVRNISAQSSEKTVKEFFLFCGKIGQFELIMDDDEIHQVALIQFERESAAKTATLLSNALIDDCHIVATPYFFETTAAVGTTLTATSSEEKQVAEDEVNAAAQESKAKSRIVAEMLANGYMLQDQVVAKGLEYDSKYSLSTRLTGYYNTLTLNVKQIDEKYRIWDKAVEIDNKFKIQEKVQNAAQTAQTTATAALQSPTGQKVERIASQTFAQIAAVHYEAKKIQKEKTVNSNTALTTSSAEPVAVA